MANRIPFGYGEFYDFPRMIDFQCGGNWYFLRSYSTKRKTITLMPTMFYLLPFRSEEEIKSNPDFLDELEQCRSFGTNPRCRTRIRRNPPTDDRRRCDRTVVIRSKEESERCCE